MGNTRYLTDATGRIIPFYHGCLEDFSVFDVAKIRADETDAVYNGFWFTSKREDASPAWRNPRYIKTCYLSLVNPAPHDVIKKVYWDIRENSGRYNSPLVRSYNDAVRLTLQSMGYDGVVHKGIPNINIHELMTKGETSYPSERGYRYILRINPRHGGLDYCYGNGEFITGYEDLNDFMRHHDDIVIVVFNPRQIKIVRTDKVK